MNQKRKCIACDFHMHTEFSTDSQSSVEEMLDSALKKGLDAVCITDHMDMDYPAEEDGEEGEFLFDVDAYFQKLSEMKKVYAGKLDVRIGVELGLQPHLGEYYKKLTEEYPFDFVIGSLHVINGTDPYYRKIFEGRTDEEVYREAFRVTLENIRMCTDFDVLGHLDYVVRYGKKQAEEYSYNKYADEIDAVLRRLIQMGKGLELNTGGLKYGLGFCNPHPDVMKRYRELGGEMVTVGSDAHRPEHVAWEFSRAAEILKSCGFRYYADFQERKPCFRRIP